MFRLVLSACGISINFIITVRRLLPATDHNSILWEVLLKFLMYIYRERDYIYKSGLVLVPK